MNPAVVESKPRFQTDEDRVIQTGADVFYHGLWVGVVTKLPTGRWLAIPTGVKKPEAFASLTHHRKEIDAVEELAQFAAERLGNGVEP